jgi:hypothetical protein
MTTTRRMVGRILTATKAAIVAATIRAAVGLKTEYDSCELNLSEMLFLIEQIALRHWVTVAFGKK